MGFVNCASIELYKDYIVNPESPTPTSKEEYIRLAVTNKKMVYMINEIDHKGWRSVDVSSYVGDIEVELFDKPPVGPAETSANTIKTIGVMDSSAQDVFDVIWSADMQVKRRYDQDIMENELLEQINPDVLVMYRLYQSPGLFVAPREFVVMNARWKSPDGVLIVYGVSVNHKSKVRSAKNVRANIIVTGTIVTPLTENSCKVVRILQLDPKGLIPAWVVNYGKKKAVNSFRTLNKVVKEIAREKKLNPTIAREPPIAETPIEPIEDKVPTAPIEGNEHTHQTPIKTKRKSKDTAADLELLRDIDVQLTELNWEVENHNKRIDYVEELLEIRMQERQLEAEKLSIKERSTWELAVMVTYITTAIYILMH